MDCQNRVSVSFCISFLIFFSYILKIRSWNINYGWVEVGGLAKANMFIDLFIFF
jgi:hypothetical protein